MAVVRALAMAANASATSARVRVVGCSAGLAWLRCEQVEGRSAQVAVAAVGGGQRGVGGAGDGEDGLAEQRAAGVQLAGVGLGEGRAGEIEGEQAGIVGARRCCVGSCNGLGDGGALLQPARRCGHLFRQLASLVEQCHGGPLSPV